MSWFQKYLGVGKKGDTVLSLKLRLNRWRHFLRTEWACNRLLSDLREKVQGEYIFDRQYVFSTVGQLFQKTYQMIYDEMILREKAETGLYRKLDQMKENAQAYLSGFSKGEGTQAASLVSKPIGTGGFPEASEDLEQEPEFQMLKGVIELLDPERPSTGNPWPEKIEEVQNLRMALHFAHQQVLEQFFKPEDWQYWITSGLAFPLTVAEGFSLYVVDLGRMSVLDKNNPGEPSQLQESLASYKPWTLFSDSLINCHEKKRKEDSLLVLIVSENSLFLYGVSLEGTLIQDMVLTRVRKLNHFFFRWQAGPLDSLLIRNLSSLWDWTGQQDQKVYELAAFQRPPMEIEKYLTQLGRGLALW